MEVTPISASYNNGMVINKVRIDRKKDIKKVTKKMLYRSIKLSQLQVTRVFYTLNYESFKALNC